MCPQACSIIPREQAQQAAFSAKFFGEWQEQFRQEDAQKVPVGDARQRIIYQFG